MKNDKILCPSSLCLEGSALIGVANAEGTIDILANPVPVTEEFALAAREESKSPETRFRFANRCVQNACKQWNGKGCGIIDMVMDFIPMEEKIRQLPACGIRKYCRWYLQAGANACSACKFVITDNSPENTHNDRTPVA